VEDHHQLDQSELFRITIEQASVAITIQDEQHRLVAVNQAYCDLTGYSKEDVIGKDPLEFALAGDNHDTALQHREAATALPGQDGSVRFTIFRELIHRNGRRIPVRLEVALAYAPDKTKRWCTWGFDLTGQQQAIEAIEKRHDLIVLETHHRIKNNLHGLAGMIEHKAMTHPQLEKPLGDVAAWLGMVGDIHGLKFEQDGQVELIGMVKAAVAGVAKLFDISIEVAVSSEAKEHSYPLSEDHTLALALVVNELLTNACKHSKQVSPRVAISTHPDGVQITVDNPGSLPVGFSLKDRSEISGGLGLILGLLPQNGVSIRLDDADQTVTASLVLSEPILTRQELQSV
jgi:PAS domain S-box-containing protein